MVSCELDKEVSGELMGWRLPAWQALLLHRVLPSCGGLLVYITYMCYDFALICEYFISGGEAMGSFCIILMVLPSVICLVFTLASPPPGFQTELSAFTVNVEKNEIWWLVMQFLNALFFPIAGIGRYCYLIFWWVEAVCASRAEDGDRIRDAIKRARAPSPVELYLFLQSFIHAAPHTIIIILDMMARWSDLSFDNVSVQGICAITAAMRMASTATVYRRFEREKLCGRQYPWGTKGDPYDDSDKEEAETEKKESEEENVYEPIMKKESIRSDSVQSNDAKYRNTNANSDLIQFSPRSTVFYEDEGFLESDNSSDDYLPPITNRNEGPYDSDDDYVKPISMIDKVAPRRRDTNYTIERVDIVPPPVMIAPRPMSFAAWAEKVVENAEAIPEWLSAPPRRKYCDEIPQDEPDIPRRVPRSFMRGLEPQDATASLVNFLGWYSFFISRLISIACFINFSPVVAIIILFSHYQVMLLFLIVPQASTVKRSFYVFLAFIYLFCLMEFKIRFRHVRLWHMFWIIVCTIEIIMFTGLWASINNNMHSWWRAYVIYVIMGSLLLSYMCFLVYFVLLKPRETIVYIRNNKDSSKA